VRDERKEVSDQVLADMLTDTVQRIEEIRREQDELLAKMTERGWSQKKIADILNVSQQAVSGRLARLKKRGAHPKTDE
jgi:DNA-directed RNA polymerase specialized sigma24 family protein